MSTGELKLLLSLKHPWCTWHKQKKHIHSYKMGRFNFEKWKLPAISGRSKPEALKLRRLRHRGDGQGSPEHIHWDFPQQCSAAQMWNTWDMRGTSFVDSPAKASSSPWKYVTFFEVVKACQGYQKWSKDCIWMVLLYLFDLFWFCLLPRSSIAGQTCW